MICRKRGAALALVKLGALLAFGAAPLLSAVVPAQTALVAATAGMAATAAMAETAAASGDAIPQQLTPGMLAFQQKCAGCHTPEVHGHGLSLKGIVGRRAGSVAGFDYYSPAMKTAGFQWDQQRLSAFLAAPGDVISGSTMKLAVTDPAERAALLDFLARY